MNKNGNFTNLVKKLNNKPIIKTIIAIAIFLGIQVISTIIFSPIYFIVSNEGTAVLIVFLLSQILSIGILTWWFITDNEYNKIELKPQKGDAGVLSIAMIVVGTYGVSMIGSGLLYVSGMYDNSASYDEFTGYMDSSLMILTILTVVILGPILEEIVFRGLIYRSIRQKMGFWLSALITSILFALVHLDIYQGIAVLPIGFFYCFLYEKFRKLWVPIAGHMINNFLAVVLSSGDTESSVELTMSVVEAVAIGIILLIIGMIVTSLVLLYYKKSKYPLMYKTTRLADVYETKDNDNKMF